MSLSESRKKKLAILTRSIAKGDFAAAGDLLRTVGGKGGKGGKSRTPEETGTPTDGTPLDPGAPEAIIPRFAPLPLAEACAGEEAFARTRDGLSGYWRLQRSLTELAPDLLPVSRKLAATLRGAGQRLEELNVSAALCHAAAATPEELLFMDIETCGLTSCPTFLIGLMYYDGEELRFDQFLARHYGEEPAIMQAFADRLAEASVLVTFNGKAFDMTMIRDRSVFHGVELPAKEPPHLDLLQEARKRWRGRVPNCRLQTLEQLFCGRARHGDIPGAAIPDAYHRFVSSGDARQLADIIHHNRLDLLTMAELLHLVLTGYEPI